MVFKKKRIGCLKSGHIPWNKGQKYQLETTKPSMPIVKYVRLTSEDLDRTMKRDRWGNFIHTPDDISEQSFTCMLLRPKESEQLPYNKMLQSTSGTAIGHRIMDMKNLLTQ